MRRRDGVLGSQTATEQRCFEPRVFVRAPSAPLFACEHDLQDVVRDARDQGGVETGANALARGV